MKVQDALLAFTGHYTEALDDGADPHEATAYTMMVVWIILHPDTIIEEEDVIGEIAERVTPLITLNDDSEATFVAIKVKPSTVFEYLADEEEAKQAFIEMCGEENLGRFETNEYVVIEEFVSTNLHGRGDLNDTQRAVLEDAVFQTRESRSEILGEAQVRSIVNGKVSKRVMPGRGGMEQMLSDLDDGPKIVSDWARQLEEGGT